MEARAARRIGAADAVNWSCPSAFAIAISMSSVNGARRVSVSAGSGVAVDEATAITPQRSPSTTRGRDAGVSGVGRSIGG
jgi:hypothetical protein